jgi:hypothetical protein
VHVLERFLAGLPGLAGDGSRDAIGPKASSKER